jgi:hypothetical protein
MRLVQATADAVPIGPEFARANSGNYNALLFERASEVGYQLAILPIWQADRFGFRGRIGPV